jgi:hypothetical protein
MAVLGGFAIMTLLLAGAAVGRVSGMSFGEALYVTVLLLITIGWLVNPYVLRQPAPSSKDWEV